MADQHQLLVYTARFPSRLFPLNQLTKRL